jgi:hypothetical protein
MKVRNIGNDGGMSVDWLSEEHPSVSWEVDEFVGDLNDRLVWQVGVQTRPNWELDFFLKTLDDHGVCTVIIEDPGGEVVYFPCRLSSELAVV